MYSCILQTVVVITLKVVSFSVFIGSMRAEFAALARIEFLFLLMKSVYGEGLNSAQLKLLLLHIFTRISFHVFHTFVHFVFFLSLFLFLHALCDLLLCFVFVHGSSPNYLLTVHHHKLKKKTMLSKIY